MGSIRVSEAEIRKNVAEILNDHKSHKMSVSDLIDEYIKTYPPHPHSVDAQILRGRNDNYLSQKIRNMVSHRNKGNNEISKELRYIPNKNKSRNGEIALV